MIFFKILFLIYTANIVLGYPTASDDDGDQELTPEQKKRLAEWTDDSLENIWTLSGQFQGDMILSPEQRNGLFDSYYRWPRNEVIYKFAPDFTWDEELEILDAMQTISNLTCIKFYTAASWDKHWILIEGKAAGCKSQVGYNHRANQRMNLQTNGCIYPGTIQHELLHAIGFHHMQSDSERDSYVQINWKNIQTKYTHNFLKYPSSEVTKFGEEYDYGSVMHYGAYDFSSNGQPTIEPTKDPSAQIGQRRGMSQSDINKVKAMYNCP